MGRLLEREGLLERDTEQLELSNVMDEDDSAQAMEAWRISAPAERSEAGMPLRVPDLVGHSITYRIAVAPHRGRKVSTLHTLPICNEEDWATGGPGNVAGFSLHAGVAVKACQHDKLERLCRYICRPPAQATQALRFRACSK